jgi:starch synthase (maltosyl-transferring)
MSAARAPGREDLTVLPPRDSEGRSRVVIEAVTPEVDAGRFPVKRVAHARVIVEADVFADGHDKLSAVVLHRRDGDPVWQAVAMTALVNDRWRAEFAVGEPGRHFYTVEGWIDRFGTWRSEMVKRIDAGQDVDVALGEGARLVRETADRAEEPVAGTLREWAAHLASGGSIAERTALALAPELAEAMAAQPDTRHATRYGRVLEIVVDPRKAEFSSWYELFPRSWSPTPAGHGTLRDAEQWIEYVAQLGFDVLYLPPIHPIGRQFRKGKNNTLNAGPDDVGSPWAIGGPEGGHEAIHPELGTIADFHRLVALARERGIEVALDIAFQCSADHPWLRDHPEWFRRRADGTIQYAENPPKKYQDIYPLDFETEDWRALWSALHGVFAYWIEQGVRIFRVDNPHTKAFAFWEWAIGAIKAETPDVLFLSEAFTRPKVMHRLAKLGFSQSYTYFTWRNTRDELVEYFSELTSPRVREYMRPNLWPNTPDILPEYLQVGGRPAFIIRVVLASTLGASYGIYGPAYELCENQPREPGSEEYRDSEKYEIRQRDLTSSWSLKDVIQRLNHIRRDNPALHSDWRLRFHHSDNGMLICYSKTTEDMANVILVVVNLDFRNTQSGWLTLDLEALGLDDRQEYQVHDLLGDGRFLWQGARNYVELNPHQVPAHVFRIRRQTRSERDFDYYL